MAAMGQGTKSLRDSPLRGGLSESEPHWFACGAPATLRDFPEAASWRRDAFPVISLSYVLPEPT
jgi:hypothetical protein